MSDRGGHGVGTRGNGNKSVALLLHLHPQDGMGGLASLSSVMPQLPPHFSTASEIMLGHESLGTRLTNYGG